MKFLVERDTLRDAFAGVIGRAKGHGVHTIPILTHVLIEAEGQRVRLTGHDLDSCSQASLAGEVSAPGSIAIPADRLTRLVSGFPDGSNVAVDADSRTANIRCGRSTYQFQLLSPDDFPSPLAPNDPVKFTLSAEVIRRLFKMPACSILTEASRPHLSGIYIHKAGKKLSACATNGHTLVRVLTDVEPPNFGGVIVPGAACDEIVRLTGDGEVSLEISQSLIAAQSGERRFVSKLIDGTFPDYGRVIPQAQSPLIAFDVAEFNAALARLVNAGDPKFARAVKLSWNGDVESVTASVRSDIGSGSEQVDCDCPGRDPGEVGANVEYLRELVDALGGKRVRFFIDGPGDPIRIENPDDAGVVAVCMPMRV